VSLFFRLSALWQLNCYNTRKGYFTSMLMYDFPCFPGECNIQVLIIWLVNLRLVFRLTWVFDFKWYMLVLFTVIYIFPRFDRAESYPFRGFRFQHPFANLQGCDCMWRFSGRFHESFIIPYLILFVMFCNEAVMVYLFVFIHMQIEANPGYRPDASTWTRLTYSALCCLFRYTPTSVPAIRLICALFWCFIWSLHCKWVQKPSRSFWVIERLNYMETLSRLYVFKWLFA